MIYITANLRLIPQLSTGGRKLAELHMMFSINKMHFMSFSNKSCFSPRTKRRCQLSMSALHSTP